MTDAARPPADQDTLARTLATIDALDDATRAVASILSVDRVLQLIVDRVRELVGARYAALGIVDAEGQIDQFVTSGIGRAARSRIGAPPRGHGLLGLIVRENRSIRVPDVDADPRRYGFPPHHPEMHSFLGVPVVVRGRTIGNLYLTEKEGGFTADDETLVESFARHAGIAIENARLHEQVQRLVVVEERERIGKDLHDGIIQAIYAVGLSLEDVPDLMTEDPPEAAARIERAIESLDQTIRDIRNFIFGLRPQLMGEVSLIEGLAALADEFRVNTLVDIDLRADGPAEALALGSDRTLEVLTIGREALSNIARHAKATRATIRVRPVGAVVEIEFVDNGVGFDPAAPRGVGHQGLRNIRTRALEMGAAIVVDSEAGAGTRIILRVPTEAHEAVADHDDS